MIVFRENKYFVVSEKKDTAGNRKTLGGPYDKHSEAVTRLKQVEYFKHKRI